MESIDTIMSEEDVLEESRSWIETIGEYARCAAGNEGSTWLVESSVEEFGEFVKAHKDEMSEAGLKELELLLAELGSNLEGEAEHLQSIASDLECISVPEL